MGQQSYGRRMAALAAAPNVRVKLSGICIPGHAWTVERNGWIVREAIALFGAERCLWASNFPVDGLVSGFAEILQAMRIITAADMLLDQRRFQEALTVLKGLPEKHTAALRLELKAQQQAKNWSEVLQLVDQLFPPHAE